MQKESILRISGWIVLVLGLLATIIILLKGTWVEHHSYNFYGNDRTYTEFKIEGLIYAILLAFMSVTNWALMHVIANMSDKITDLADNAEIKQI